MGSPAGGIRLARLQGGQDRIVATAQDDRTARKSELPRRGLGDPADGRMAWQQLRQAIHVLTRVWRQAEPAGLTAGAYCLRFRHDVSENTAELTDQTFELSSDLPHIVAAALLRFLEKRFDLLDARVEDGRIVEGHGDLRPEHVYLLERPIIMDCLEFNRDLRLLDPVDELAYLGIECHRLGAPHLGEVVLETYQADTGDRAPDALLDFYACARAMLRAKLAIWHLKDEHRPDAEKWRKRTLDYLHIAAEHAVKLDRAP